MHGAGARAQFSENPRFEKQRKCSQSQKGTGLQGRKAIFVTTRIGLGWLRTTVSPRTAASGFIRQGLARKAQGRLRSTRLHRRPAQFCSTGIAPIGSSAVAGPVSRGHCVAFVLKDKYSIHMWFLGRILGRQNACCYPSKTP